MVWFWGHTRRSLVFWFHPDRYVPDYSQEDSRSEGSSARDQGGAEGLVGVWVV